MLHGGKFLTVGHEYQVALLQSDNPFEVWKKAAQMTFTESAIIWTVHGLLHDRFPHGGMYLFPTSKDVSDFSKGRWRPLIDDNPKMIGRYVRDTDAVNIKEVGRAMLYFRGTRITGKIEGTKATSTSLKTVPADVLIYDEYDEMDPRMVDLAMERLSHASVDGIPGKKYWRKLSTPSIPGWGIDVAFRDTTQHVWMIKCEKCGKSTCLELSFPDCLQVQRDGRVLRVCPKCKEGILAPWRGQWVAQYPDRDIVGRWISQLNSIYVDPGEILDAYRNPGRPGDGTNRATKQEVMNSKLGLAYIEADQMLQPHDVWACQTADVMAANHPGPCAMGVDVGDMLHVTVFDRPNDTAIRLVYVARVSKFHDVHDIGRRFNVRCAVIDGEPERRAARAFQDAEEYDVWLCDEQGNRKRPAGWDERDRIISINRTEYLDMSHQIVTAAGQFLIPRRNEELEEYVKEMCAIAKILKTDPETGASQFVYKNVGPDHYRHSTVFGILASDQIPTLMEGKRHANPWYHQQEFADSGDDDLL